MILKIKFYTSYISCESIVKNTLLAGKKIVLKVFTFLVWVRKMPFVIFISALCDLLPSMNELLKLNR